MIESAGSQGRVLVLAPTAKDAKTTETLLGQVGLTCILCDNVRDLAGKIKLGAEAALLTLVKGKPTHLSAWHATVATLGKQRLWKSAQAKDLDVAVK